MASAASAGAGAGDCEGEEQEDPPSSNHSVCDATEALDKLGLDDEKKDVEDELAVFRQQWKRELQSTPSPHKESRPPEPPQPRGPAPQLTDEEKAKQLFICGVELERGGKLYEAIQHYKRAIQILPDVEARLYEGSELRADTPEVEYEITEVCRSEQAEESDDEDAVEGEELVARLQRILARKGHLFQPEYHTKSAHISWLPYEVLRLVLRWVVGAELDAGSLERAAAACRGLYVAAREPDLWRTMCVKTWGIDCGTPRAHGYANWRHMYVERSRLNLNGCYISKTTYLRHGENSFQDHCYRPWYLVDYYRYLRFFPEGLVLMWTTAEEPASCVGHLKYRETKTSLGIMSGHYRLVGDTVVILIRKAASEKTPATNTRFRARRKEPQHEQVFQLELQVRSVRSRRNWQLVWRRYAVSTRRDQWSAFELAPSKFPPFAFSTVRNYTAEAHAPLQTCA